MQSIDDMMRIVEEHVDAGPLPNLTSLPANISIFCVISAVCTRFNAVY